VKTYVDTIRWVNAELKAKAIEMLDLGKLYEPK